MNTGPSIEATHMHDQLLLNCMRGFMLMLGLLIAAACMQIKAISAWQLPPRGVWMFLVGGLSVLEGFLLAVWLVLHAVMFWNWYTNYVKGYDYGEQHCRLQCVSCILHRHNVINVASSKRACCGLCFDAFVQTQRC